MGYKYIRTPRQQKYFDEYGTDLSGDVRFEKNSRGYRKVIRLREVGLNVEAVVEELLRQIKVPKR